MLRAPRSGGCSRGCAGACRRDPRSRPRRATARQDRDAAAARLDRPGGSEARRSDARELPRDRRSEEPRGRAAVAAGHAGSLPRRIRLGRRQPGGQSARAADPLDRVGRDPHSDQPRHFDLGQRAGTGLHASDQRRSELHVHGSRLGPQYRHHAGKVAALRADQPHRHAACRRLLHSARGSDRLSRRLAAGSEIFLAQPGNPARLCVRRAAGSALPTNIG